MEGSIALNAWEHKTLLEHYRKSTDTAFRLRTHILLLLADGDPRSRIAATVYTSTSTIQRWKGRFEPEGLEGVLQSQRGRPLVLLSWLVALVVHWVTGKNAMRFRIPAEPMVLCHDRVTVVTRAKRTRQRRNRSPLVAPAAVGPASAVSGARSKRPRPCS